MSGTAPLFEVRNLCVAYPAAAGTPRRAVHDVSFALQAGCIFGLVGESGSGKTSLVRALLGLVPAQSGTLAFRGRDLAGMPVADRRAVRRAIQHVFQDPAAALSPRRTVRQSLEEPLGLYRVAPRAHWADRMARVLAAVGLESGILGRFPHELSGGQRQRVALARALISEPALILADEPLSSLDASAQAAIIGLIRDLRDQLGVAFLLISHDLAVVQQLADHVGVMYRGHVVERAPAATLFRGPAHPYTQALLAATLGEPGSGPAALRAEPPSALTPQPGCVFHTRCPRFMNRCSHEAPGETLLRPGAGSFPAHRVRCHLWS